MNTNTLLVVVYNVYAAPTQAFGSVQLMELLTDCHTWNGPFDDPHGTVPKITKSQSPKSAIVNGVHGVQPEATTVFE